MTTLSNFFKSRRSLSPVTRYAQPELIAAARIRSSSGSGMPSAPRGIAQGVFVFRRRLSTGGMPDAETKFHPQLPKSTLRGKSSMKSKRSTASLPPHLATQAVGSQDGEPDISVEQDAHEAGRRFPLRSAGLCAASGQKQRANDPVRFPRKKDSRKAARLPRPEASGFL
jgi:hypothetical protein